MTLALAEATAEFADGKIFKECADATPSNVNPKVKPHFPRMALNESQGEGVKRCTEHLNVLSGRNGSLSSHP